MNGPTGNALEMTFAIHEMSINQVNNHIGDENLNHLDKTWFPTDQEATEDDDAVDYVLVLDPELNHMDSAENNEQICVEDDHKMDMLDKTWMPCDAEINLSDMHSEDLSAIHTQYSENQATLQLDSTWNLFRSPSSPPNDAPTDAAVQLQADAVKSSTWLLQNGVELMQAEEEENANKSGSSLKVHVNNDIVENAYLQEVNGNQLMLEGKSDEADKLDDMLLQGSERDSRESEFTNITDLLKTSSDVDENMEDGIHVDKAMETRDHTGVHKNGCQSKKRRYQMNIPNICPSCDDKLPVVSVCYVCPDVTFLCQICVDAHRRVRVTRNHTLNRVAAGMEQP